MHLKADELIDLAEGGRAESSAPHLLRCDVCRKQLAELRAVMSVVADAPVPEPSPLFWGHFSERVLEQIAAEAESPRREAVPFIRTLLASRRWRVGAAAVAVLIMVVVATSRTRAPGQGAGNRETVVSAAPELFADAPIEKDESLSFMAMLTADLDADAVVDTGLARVGSAEHAVTHMSSGELRELQRLLQEQMAP